MVEAGSLQQREEDFRDETGIPLSYVVIVFEGTNGQRPSAGVAPLYWEAIDEPSFPVVADTDQACLEATDFNGRNLAGKCLISPEMEILACTTGHGPDDWAYDIVTEREGQ